MNKNLILRSIKRYKYLDRKLRKIPFYLKFSKLIYSKSYAPFFKNNNKNEHIEKYYLDYNTTIIDNKIALFDSDNGQKIGCNPYAIFIEMYNRSQFTDVKFYWTLRSQVSPPSWMVDNDRINFIDPSSISFIEALLIAKYIISNSELPYYFVRKDEQIHINTLYSSLIKNSIINNNKNKSNIIKVQRNIIQSTHLLLTNEYAIEKQLPELYDTGLNSESKIIGAPRLDLTFRTTRKEIQDELKLPNNKKIILYAPALNLNRSTEDAYFEINRQINFIRKIASKVGDDHYFILVTYNNINPSLKNIPPNCKLVPSNIDINEVLAGADVLITDYSNIAFDFLVLDRPVILYVSDTKNHKDECHTSLDINEMPVVIANKPNQLKEAIINLKKPSAFPQYRQFMDMMMPIKERDGTASARVVDVLLKKPPEPLEKIMTAKKSIIFFAGGLKNNQITRGFIRLLNRINKDRFDIYIIASLNAVKSIEQDDKLKIPVRCKIIIRTNQMSIAKSDVRSMNDWKIGNQPENMAAVNAAVLHDVHRVLGDKKFDYAVDYYGKSPFWAKFIEHVPAKKRLIYQRSDLLSEANETTKPKKQLVNVFLTYQRYDHIVAHSQEIKDKNIEGLHQYYGDSNKALIVGHEPYVLSSKVTLDAERYYNQYTTTHVDENLVFLDCYWGGRISCNPYAVFLEMYQRKQLANIKFCWVKKPGVYAPSWMLESDRISFVEYQSPEYTLAILKAKILIINVTLPHYFVRKPCQVYVNTWHGIPLKYMGLDVPQKLADIVNIQRSYIQSTHILLASEYAKEKTVLSFGNSISTDKVFNVGSPRVDLTLNSKYSTVQHHLNVPEGKKLILYAPTWRGTFSRISSDIDEQLAVIDSLEKQFGGEYQIMLSIHNITRGRMGCLPQNCTHVPDNITINEILAGVDILISDYSSIFFDFLVLDRPIILHVSDLESYKAERGLYLDLTELPVMITKNLNELGAALKAPKNPSQFLGYKEFMSKVMPYEDGNASVRAVDLFVNEFERPTTTSNSTKKSILFYGGGYLQNGITHAFLNLVNSLDQNLLDIFILVDPRLNDQSKVRRALFERVPKYCKVIFRSHQISSSEKDNSTLLDWSSGAKMTKQQMIIVDEVMAHEVRRVLGDRKFDLAVDYGGYSPYWAKFISLSNAEKSYIYQHSDLFKEENNPLKRMKQLHSVFETYKTFDFIVSVSPIIKEINQQNLGKYYGDSSKAIATSNLIIPSLILNKSNEKSPVPLKYSILSYFKIKEQPVKFITVGRLSPEKNQMLLIQSMKKVIDSGIHAQLYIVGNGKQMSELVDECEKLKISKFVFFTGSVSNPFPLLKACDCFVLTSFYEGYPMVLLEALTLGKYCIGSDIPSINHILNDNGCTAQLNPDDFASAMIDFALNKNDRMNSINYDAQKQQKKSVDEFYRMLEL